MPMEAPERYEQLIAFLASHLLGEQSELADGTLQFVGGDPPEVIALLTDTSVMVFEYAAKPRRVGSLKWRRLPETALFNALGILLKGAREARLSAFRTCEECGRSTPPEWMDQDQVCQTCADQIRRREIVH